MPRNLMIDAAALTGAEPVAVRTIHKRFNQPMHPDKDLRDLRKFLQVETGPTGDNDDFGTKHPHAFEFRKDMPEQCKKRDNSSLFEFEGLPILLDKPNAPGQRRNLMLDIEAIAQDAVLINVVLVLKRHGGPPPGWVPPEPGVPPPTEHFGPDCFLHCLLAHDDALPDDLTDTSAHAREFLQGIHPTMRRQDGGPLHVFLGQPVHWQKPTPPPPGAP